jgi:hypothetical protein
LFYNILDRHCISSIASVLADFHFCSLVFFVMATLLPVFVTRLALDICVNLWMLLMPLLATAVALQLPRRQYIIEQH